MVQDPDIVPGLGERVSELASFISATIVNDDHFPAVIVRNRFHIVTEDGQVFLHNRGFVVSRHNQRNKRLEGLQLSSRTSSYNRRQFSVYLNYRCDSGDKVPLLAIWL